MATRRAALVALIGLVAAGCAAAPSKPLEEKISVSYDGISPGAAHAIAAKMAEERRRIRDWWGPTFEGTIHVDIAPQYRIPRSIVPAWLGRRGVLEHPARGADNRATAHEITHIYAPNGNRFLAEGLAVYAQSRFGAGHAYPDFGQDLHRLAAGLGPVADPVALDRIATPNRLRIEGRIAERDAYITAGSFVAFLIERYGMEKFRALYALTPLRVNDRHAGGNPARWESIYGKPLPALAVDWRAFLAARAPSG